MAMTSATIKNAILANYPGTPSVEQVNGAQTIADAIVATIASATIIYTSGLAAPDGPVTGVFTGSLE